MMTSREFKLLGVYKNKFGESEEIFSNSKGIEKCPTCGIVVKLGRSLQKYIKKLDEIFGFRFKNPGDEFDVNQSNCKKCRRELR